MLNNIETTHHLLNPTDDGETGDDADYFLLFHLTPRMCACVRICCIYRHVCTRLFGWVLCCIFTKEK